MGQPLYHFTPLFEAFEDLPLVPYRQRCYESNNTCEAAVAALYASPSHTQTKALPQAVEAKARRRLCSATHGEMDGVDIGVTTWTGLSVEQRDHSCCSRCRAVPSCEFWVRSTKTNDCWLRRSFSRFVDSGDRRGSFVERVTEEAYG